MGRILMVQAFNEDGSIFAVISVNVGLCFGRLGYFVTTLYNNLYLREVYFAMGDRSGMEDYIYRILDRVEFHDAGLFQKFTNQDGNIINVLLREGHVDDILYLFCGGVL